MRHAFTRSYIRTSRVSTASAAFPFFPYVYLLLSQAHGLSVCTAFSEIKELVEYTGNGEHRDID